MRSSSAWWVGCSAATTAPSPEAKFADIPFAVFAEFNHGSIVDPAPPGFFANDGPGTLALAALTTVDSPATYAQMAARFRQADAANYEAMAT